MRAAFHLLALAPAAIATPAFATTYYTVAQAQALMFPGATLTPDERTLSDAQVAAIQRQSGVNVLSRTLHAWRASTGGWFIADQVVGKHEFITIGLGLDANGAVRDLEILDYRESYGYQVRDAAWRAQFTGVRPGAPLRLGQEIRNISGASLSSRHITDAVRRLLTTYALVLSGS
jgi:hypothetical protein